jgi:phosphoribosylaminoimidazolecarboxamide formyltransferase/IMP cyclohydrolase
MATATTSRLTTSLSNVSVASPRHSAAAAAARQALPQPRRRALALAASKTPAQGLLAVGSTVRSTVRCRVQIKGAASQGAKQALILLSDKRSLALLAQGLDELGYKFLSAGDTATALENAGYSVTRVEQPEMRANSHGIGTIDIVVVNLHLVNITDVTFDFEKTEENIDLPGSALIRAAAKNYKDAMVVVDPDDYAQVLAALRSGQGDGSAFRRRLAWKAFHHFAAAEWLWKEQQQEAEFPPSLTVSLTLSSELRYGENQHQRAAFYEETPRCGGGFVQHHGRAMSYNNYLDADAAWNCVSEFPNPTCVVVKHTNPCGVASNESLLEAYRRAVMADPVSAYGGIVAFNVEVDERLAMEIREFRSLGEARPAFYELVVAPSYTEKGLALLKGKSKALRILKAEGIQRGRRSLRQIGAGWLVQDCDEIDFGFRVVTSAVPTPALVEDAKFAWRCCKHVKSNAVVVAKGNRMLGMGSGQPNRAQSLRIALERAGDGANGAALASDACFPFAWNDAVEDACKAGVQVIVQPGGSKRDQDAIDCCNKHEVAMLFTGVRHFRH